MSLSSYVDLAVRSFSFPDVCVRLRQVLDDARSDNDDVAELISVDPSLSAKILKLANSALFRFPSQVVSVSKAVTVIGGEALYNLVIAETSGAAYKAFDSKLVDQQAHWARSVYFGVLAKYLGKQCKIRGNDRFFVLGMLHGLSELIVAKASPEKYSEYLQDDSQLPTWEKQEKYFGFSFAFCSGTILEAWKLPISLYVPLQNMHKLDRNSVDKDVALMVATASLVDVTPEILASNTNTVLEDVSQLLNLTPAIIEEAVFYAKRETEKVAASLK